MPSGTIKRWNGTSWKTGATLKRWNGSAWKTGATIRRFNGSVWVPAASGGGAAVSFVGTSGIETAGVNNASFNLPALSAGDLIVLVHVSNSATDATGKITSEPPGYTTLDAYDDPCFTRLYYKIASGAESGTAVAWNWSSFTRKALGAVVYRGATGVGVNNFNTQGSSSATHTAPAITVQDQSWKLEICCERSTLTTSTPPGGRNNRAFYGGSAQSGACSVHFVDMGPLAAGSAAAGAFTTDLATSNAVMWSVEILN